MNGLPEPDADAQAASARLVARLCGHIHDAGGWIGFDRFMDAVLYEPALGYYSGGSRRFGAGGDFVTAPELSPLFGACIARQCARWFERLDTPRIVEFGAGTGQLAAQILNELARCGIGDAEYQIVEVSAALREVQRSTLTTLAPTHLAQVRWLDTLPGKIEAVVIGNELIDAMPVRLFRVERADIFERGVAARTGEPPRDDPFASPFAFADRPADAAFAGRVRAALAASGWAEEGEAAGGPWADGYQSELSEQGPGWLASVGERLARGVVLLLDYGFPAREYYHPQRDQGTLACHYRHRVHHDPLILAGLQDVTAHVDFSALARAAEAVGLACLGYSSQGSFLLGAGLLDLLAHAGQPASESWLRQAQAIGRLVGEAEMGELFKVIAFTRGAGFDDTAFARGDRQAMLGP